MNEWGGGGYIYLLGDKSDLEGRESKNSYLPRIYYYCYYYNYNYHHHHYYLCVYMFEKVYLRCSSFVPFPPFFEALFLIVLGLAFLPSWLCDYSQDLLYSPLNKNQKHILGIKHRPSCLQGKHFELTDFSCKSCFGAYHIG